jgi:hypothetical protein
MFPTNYHLGISGKWTIGQRQEVFLKTKRLKEKKELHEKFSFYTGQRSWFFYNKYVWLLPRKHESANYKTGLRTGVQ